MIKRIVEIGFMLLCFSQGILAATGVKEITPLQEENTTDNNKPYKVLTPEEVMSLGGNPYSCATLGMRVRVVKEPIEIFNTVTPRHTNIANFDYAIALPNTGYKQTSANLATTFYNEVNDATIVISQPAESGVNEGDEYKINGFKAFIQSKKENDKAIKTLYLLTNYPLIVEASCKATDTITINQMEKCLLSIVPTVISRGQKSFENTLFSISNGGYEAECSGSNFTIFTPSGASKNDEERGLRNYFQILVTKKDANQKAGKKEAKAFINGIVDNNLKGGKITKNKKTTINGVNGFEYEIERKDDEGQLTDKSYAVVLETENRIYLFLSNANKDIEQNIAKYKELAKTLKTK